MKTRKVLKYKKPERNRFYWTHDYEDGLGELDTGRLYRRQKG